MFYDERINAESGKIYGRGILYATLIALVTGLFRGIYLWKIGELHLAYLICELVIVACGAVILLAGKAQYSGEADERTLAEKHAFYILFDRGPLGLCLVHPGQSEQAV